MLKYNLIILLFPIFLFSQEQVSDIDYKGVYKETSLESRIGFALIDGTQYMLKENDTLGIYKFENDSFQYHKTFKFNICKPKSSQLINPNRSQFEISGRYYYRFLEDELQIVDIVLGSLVERYNFSNHNIARINLIELYQNKLYFSGLQNDMQRNFILDLETGNMRNYFQPTGRVNEIQHLDYILGIEDQKKVYAYHPFTNNNSLIYESEIGIHSTSFSEQDSSHVILENDGSVWKIDKDLSLIKTMMIIPNLSDFKSFKVNGDKVIAIYNHITTTDRQDKVFVLDLKTGQEDLSFITDVIENYAYRIQYVINENNHKDFSIFGFTGENPTDGLVKGLYYIIDHNKNIASPIYDISFMASYTPIIYKDIIYAVGELSSYWGSSSYIIKHDLNTSTTSNLYPAQNYFTNDVKLGFIDDEELVVATNSYEEDPAIWKINSYENFTRIQSIDFLNNLGINDVSNILPQDDRIYFTTNVGLYSVLDDSKAEIVFDYNPIILDDQIDTEILVYDNKIVVPQIIDDGIKFTILNTETGDIDSIVENKFKPQKYSIVPLGSSIFFSQGSIGDSLCMIDFRTETVRTIEGQNQLSSVRLTKGQKNAIYLETTLNSSNTTVYLIDYETYTFKVLDIELRNFIDVAAGFDNSYYFIDRESFNGETRVQLLKENGEVSTIYDGYGRAFSGKTISASPDMPTTTINLTHNDSTSIIISNDLENTYTVEMPNLSRNVYNYTLENEYQGKYILKTTDNLGDHYWFYEPFNPVVEIETPIGDRLVFSDLTYDFVVLIFTSDDSNTSIIRFDYKNFERYTFDDLELDCELSIFYDKIAFTSSKYIVSAFCNSEREPHVLDINSGSLSLLADLNVGNGSSNPSNYLRYKDWIYFTATLKDKSKQWFRLEADPETNNLETVNDDQVELNIFPSPSSSNIFINHDLEELFIYTMNGQMLHRKDNYSSGSAIPISAFPSGSYLVIAKNRKGEILQEKFIKID